MNSPNEHEIDKIRSSVIFKINFKFYSEPYILRFIYIVAIPIPFSPLISKLKFRFFFHLPMIYQDIHDISKFILP